MQGITKGLQHSSGKTKVIWSVEEDDSVVVLESTANITALDNPDLTKQFGSKAETATRTTCNVFQLLADAGLPVAYKGRLSETEFLAPKCAMIPLEVVARRYAVGSYLKRHPELERAGEQPYRFHKLEIEFFLKTTGGQLVIDSMLAVDGLDPKAGEEDPFIGDPYASEWSLFHSKKPEWDSAADLKRTIDADTIQKILQRAAVDEMERLTRGCFLVLEKAWAMLGYHLIDFKIEFGIGPDGTLYIADVIDNDSWRLRTADWKELSKQLFRDGEDLAKVEEAYKIVATLSERFRIPKQALVIWTGSDKDQVDGVPTAHNPATAGFEVERVVKSAHKSTRAALEILNVLQGKYPSGGVIIAAVGRSNGLGPVLATHTDWPVIALPMSIDKDPQDIWSSIRMPSNVPLMTAWPAGNAIQAALNILAQSNPAVYANQHLALEDLDR